MFNRIYILILALIILSSCSTLFPLRNEIKGTPYIVIPLDDLSTLKPYGIKIANRHQEPSFEIIKVIFRGNKETTQLLADTYTLIAGHQECLSRNKYGYLISKDNKNSNLPHELKVRDDLKNKINGNFINRLLDNAIEDEKTSMRGFICYKIFNLIKNDFSYKEVNNKGIGKKILKDSKSVLIVTQTYSENSLFKDNDIIISIAGERVTSLQDYYKVIDTLPPGTISKAEIIRNNQLIDVEIYIYDNKPFLYDNIKKETEISCSYIRDIYNSKIDEFNNEEQKLEWIDFNKEVLEACSKIEDYLSKLALKDKF